MKPRAPYRSEFYKRLRILVSNNAFEAFSKALEHRLRLEDTTQPSLAFEDWIREQLRSAAVDMAHKLAVNGSATVRITTKGIEVE